jgi:hypothetical protein
MATVEVVVGALNGAVVVEPAAVVGGELVFGVVVATEEPHPSVTIPATGIRAAAAKRFTMGMYPSRTCERRHWVAGVWGDVP